MCCGSPSLGIISSQSLRVEGSRSEEQGVYMDVETNEDSPREMTSVRQFNSIPEYVEYMGDRGKFPSRELCQGLH